MIQSTKKIQIPWWLYIILFMEIWPMFVGPYLALTNPAFLGGPEASNLVVGSLIYLARNFAVGIAFFIAIYLKNASMIFILIFIRFFTEFGSNIPLFLSLSVERISLSQSFNSLLNQSLIGIPNPIFDLYMTFLGKYSSIAN